MSTSTFERRAFLGAATGSAIAALSPAARAADSIEWKMVTSWPKNSPGPGVTAQRLAKRIQTLSAGRLKISVYGAGELVPALEVFDAVAEGAADLGHSAAFFWQGKAKASVFFTAVPFGMTAAEHSAWIYHGDGQALWDELYRPFGVRAFMAGNTGIGMGGWFKKEITSLDSLKGLKYRIPGLGGAIFKRLGSVPVAIPPGEIFAALQSGVVDGAEFLGPWSDLAFGFYKAAPYYYWPGFHEPNGTGECLLNRQRFDALPLELQQIVETACMAENAYALAETEWHNSEALIALTARPEVEIRAFPHDVQHAARAAAESVLKEFAASDEITQAIYRSYEAARQRAMDWSRISTSAFLQARAGEH